MIIIQNKLHKTLILDNKIKMEKTRFDRIIAMSTLFCGENKLTNVTILHRYKMISRANCRGWLAL